MKIENIFFHTTSNFLFVLRDFFDIDILKSRQSKITSSDSIGELGIYEDSFRVQKTWYEIWNEKTLPNEIKKFTQVIFPPQIRKLQDVKCNVPWHQDWMYLSKKIMPEKPHEDFCVCFIPFNDYPTQYPTVEFVNNPSQGKLKHKQKFESKFNSFFLDDKFYDICSFELNFGDALIFGNQVVHRTCVKEGHKHGRLSQEFRITTDESRLVGKDYYDLNKNKLDIYFKDKD
tara:strand:+ start:1807 stop:2496 length:690 start_codon:yes stop_codon:yes gene_type:complete